MPKRGAAKLASKSAAATRASARQEAKNQGGKANDRSSGAVRAKGQPRKSTGVTCVDGAGPQPWTPEKAVAEIRRVYAANANAVYAPVIKQYMRNQFEYFGMKSPVRKQLDAELYETLGLKKGDDCEWTSPQLHALVRALWRQSEREFQYFALDMARKLLDRVLYDFDRAVELLYFMITNKSWWDTVDTIAPHLVGALVTRQPSRGAILMDRWIGDQHLWIRRAAILHQLAYKRDCKEEVLFRYCLTCAHETDFFIRKAIGWALRSHAYVNPSAIKGFVGTYDEKLSPLSKKEGLKHLGGWPSKK